MAWHREYRRHAIAALKGRRKVGSKAYYGQCKTRSSRRRQYQILVRPDGEEDFRPTNVTFKNRREAQNFAYVETIAGQGEDYIVRKNKI